MLERIKSHRQIFMWIGIGLLALAGGVVVYALFFEDRPPFPGGRDLDYKPVIYLYPEKEQQVKVQLDYHGTLIADYPSYDETLKGWEVIARPDGTLINLADQKEYSYLFREGIPNKQPAYNLTKGFVVKGSETRAFLQKTLSKIGLTPREYNEFIVFRYPRIKDNAYNLITFAGEEYTQNAPLTITPAPDALLRVFMVVKPLEKYEHVEEQELPHFERKGFTVVEWGGTEIGEKFPSSGSNGK